MNEAPFYVLRAFARNANEKQKEDYVVRDTLYDILHSMQEDRKTLITLHGGKEPTITSLATYYFGGKSPSPTIRSVAKIAISLSESVVEEFGELLNGEEPTNAY